MDKEKIAQHKLAAEKLNLIKDEAFELIGKNIGKISECEVNKFILSEFKKNGLVTQKEYPTQIIAFDRNTSFVHYYPQKRKDMVIGKNQLVLIDIWAKLNEKSAPFADITWMGYVGKNIPEEIKKNFKLVVGARKSVIEFIKNNLREKKLPKSVEIETVTRKYFNKFGVEKLFTHGVGHSLGISKDHGNYFRFSKKTKSRLKINIPFTIEPGLYIKDGFGLRSEIDCYINNDYKLIITTKVQREIVKI